MRLVKLLTAVPKPKRKPARPRQWGTTLPTSAKRPAKKNVARRGREFERAYGSEERVSWVQQQPSVVSGKGPCVNAHVRTGGAGRKADARWIVPLTDAEHRELHSIGKLRFEIAHDVNLDQWAHITERRWQEFVETRP